MLTGNVSVHMCAGATHHTSQTRRRTCAHAHTHTEHSTTLHSAICVIAAEKGKGPEQGGGTWGLRPGEVAGDDLSDTDRQAGSLEVLGWVLHTRALLLVWSQDTALQGL